MPQGPKDRLPPALGRINLLTRGTYEKLQSILMRLETIFSDQDFEWVETNMGKRVRLKRTARRRKGKVLPFEVFLITEPPETEGANPTYKVQVAPGRVNERIPDETEALKAIEPANLRTGPGSDELTEFPIEIGESVYVKISVDEDGGIGLAGAGDAVEIVVDADDIETVHYQPKVDDETTDGVVGTYYYKLANLIEGPTTPHPARLENVLAGSHLSHWRDLPSLRNTGSDGETQGLILQKWDQAAKNYKLRVLTPGLGKTHTETDGDQVVVRGNKIDGLMDVWIGDVQVTDGGFLNWRDGLVETGAEVNGDEDPAVDPGELDLYLADVVGLPANAQVTVTEIGVQGRVYQVRGNSKNGSLVVNGEVKLSWVDGLVTKNGNVEIQVLPNGSHGDMLFYDAAGWKVLPAPPPTGLETNVLTHDGVDLAAVPPILNVPKWTETDSP